MHFPCDICEQPQASNQNQSRLGCCVTSRCLRGQLESRMQCCSYFRILATAGVSRKEFSFALQNEHVATLLPQLRKEEMQWKAPSSFIVSVQAGVGGSLGGKCDSRDQDLAAAAMRHSLTFCINLSAPGIQLALSLEEVLRPNSHL